MGETPEGFSQMCQCTLWEQEHFPQGGGGGGGTDFVHTFEYCRPIIAVVREFS